MNESVIVKFGFLNLLVFILSIYVLLSLLIDTLFILPVEVSRILEYTDNAICAVFFIDFCIRWYQSENKYLYIRWGWIDLLSSIPTIDFLRAGRALRLIRLLRIIRAFRSTKKFLNHIFENKAQGTFASVSIIAILLVIFSAIAMLHFEDHPDSNIKTAEDALWWAYVTITTVGYGDKYPITFEGRFIAVILMTAGVGLFGTFTAFVASWFISDSKQSEGDIQKK